MSLLLILHRKDPDVVIDLDSHSVHEIADSFSSQKCRSHLLYGVHTVELRKRINHQSDLDLFTGYQILLVGRGLEFRLGLDASKSRKQAWLVAEKIAVYLDIEFVDLS